MSRSTEPLRLILMPFVPAVAAVLFAATVATGPAYLAVSRTLPVGWASPALVYLLLGYVAAGVAVGAFACLRALLGPLEVRPTGRFWALLRTPLYLQRRPRRARSRHVPAGLLAGIRRGGTGAGDSPG